MMTARDRSLLITPCRLSDSSLALSQIDKVASTTQNSPRYSELMMEILSVKTNSLHSRLSFVFSVHIRHSICVDIPFPVVMHTFLRPH